MQITMQQDELETAVREYVSKMVPTLEIASLDFTATRGDKGIVTTLELGMSASAEASDAPFDVTPKPQKVAKKSTLVPPVEKAPEAPAPKAEETAPEKAEEKVEEPVQTEVPAEAPAETAQAAVPAGTSLFQ